MSWAGRRNGVLSALLPAPGSRATLGLDPGAELVRLHTCEVVHRAGQPITHVVFPVGCVVSLAAKEGDDTVDVTTVGREGPVGLAALLGATSWDTEAVCRVPGDALRLSAASLQRLLAGEHGSAVTQSYVRSVVTVLEQRVVCNRSHGGDVRCACWLLQTQDRVGRDSFELSHTTLATMLGVRRATVSDSLADLQRRAVVRSRRGVLTVLDRPALAASACACYRVFRREFDRTFA